MTAVTNKRKKEALGNEAFSHLREGGALVLLYAIRGHR